MAFRISRSPISTDTFSLIPLVDPALLAGVDDDDDDEHDYDNTSLAGVHDEDTSLIGVPVPNTTVMTNVDEESEEEPNHDSVDPMRPMTIQAKHLYTAPDAISLFTVPLVNHHNTLQMRQMMWNYPSWKLKFPYYVDQKSLYPTMQLIPWMGCKTYVTNVQTKTNEDQDSGLVYDHDEARVLVPVITSFNKHMESKVEEHRQQHVVTYGLKTGINKFGN